MKMPLEDINLFIILFKVKIDNYLDNIITNKI